MAFADFTMQSLRARFGVDVRDELGLFDAVADVPPSANLQHRLADDLEFATAVGNEATRAQFLIAPILSELRARHRTKISLFPQTELNVDAELGLTGVCDYLISADPTQYVMKVPVVCVIEAKRDDLTTGTAQCMAAMIAAQRFNERESRTVDSIFGCVTTGTNWRFLQLRGEVFTLERHEYTLDRLPKILGILSWMAVGSAG